MAKAKKTTKKPAKKAPAKTGGVSKNYVDAKFKSLQQQVEDLVKRVEALEAKLGAQEKKEESGEGVAQGAGETGG